MNVPIKREKLSHDTLLVACIIKIFYILGVPDVPNYAVWAFFWNFPKLQKFGLKFNKVDLSFYDLFYLI